jgi:dGTPase
MNAPVLQRYACHPEATRGRRHPEPAPLARNEFQRDRDRIVHSTAFRRLVYKTQVFLNHEGDLFRTRLTHSLEVAQVARSVARSLGLHEDLVEAISLAHDLGHTPFGHAGQEALDACLRAEDAGSTGFEHNFQSLRVVDSLEERYPEFDGLNLTYETREGILKHCAARNARWLEAAEPGGVGHRFLASERPGLEAQLCNLADEVAYNAHDVDDGVRAGLLVVDEVYEVPLVRRFHDEALAAHPGLVDRRLLFETVRRMLSEQIYDLVAHSTVLIERHAPRDVDEVRRMPALIGFSPGMQALQIELKRFLRQRLYQHPRVQQTTSLAREVVATLFRAYVDDPRCMPGFATPGSPGLRAVADYIAGMTDRFALREHHRLTGRDVFP